MNPPNNWYVITGAPSSGKTTLIKLLESDGYNVVHEAARTYIDAELAKGRKIESVRENEIEFQKKVLELKINTELAIPKDQLTFFDRGIPDSIAYYSLFGAANDPYLNQAVRRSSYKKVFLLEMTSIEYEKDYARVESEEERRQIHNLLLSGYISLGVPVATIPPGNPEGRINQIIAQL